MKLLIVDDSLAIRRKIERCAKTYLDDIVIFTAANGQEAIDLFHQQLPDVVTMDLTMPLLDGVDCIKSLINISPDVHILVVSALSDKVTALTAIRQGAEGFLKKPFADHDLKNALAELLLKESVN